MSNLHTYLPQDCLRALARGKTLPDRGRRESLRIANETRGAWVVLEALVGIPSPQAKRGECEQALELLLIVLNHPVSIQETKDRAARLRTELEVDLTSSQIKTIQAHAAERNFEDIVEGFLG